ncbi:hypothetical protein LTR36_008913 [Oleoguttula mirabilis]|uniref:Uncharacterized protein n=1 Tax=Oleoguttula mirabilis TaxID=1507867 RepID=A0AAV9J6U1_9PEZI|nr:hypothetical protein LTR36_008913 [Oleoguttula mirabilis]
MGAPETGPSPSSQSGAGHKRKLPWLDPLGGREKRRSPLRHVDISSGSAWSRHGGPVVPGPIAPELLQSTEPPRQQENMNRKSTAFGPENRMVTFNGMTVELPAHTPIQSALRGTSSKPRSHVERDTGFTGKEAKRAEIPNDKPMLEAELSNPAGPLQPTRLAPKGTTPNGFFSSSRKGRSAHSSHRGDANNGYCSEDDANREGGQYQQTQGGVPRAGFFDQLILNIQRSQHLDIDEAALRMSSRADEAEKDRLVARVRIACVEQRLRDSELYRIADDDMARLETDALFLELGDGFAQKLERNCKHHFAMDAESDRVGILKATTEGKRQLWDALAREQATSKLLHKTEDELDDLGTRRTLETFAHEEMEAGVEHVNALRGLDHLFDTSREEARELYGLAEPILLDKGLLPPGGSTKPTTPDSDRDSERRPQAQADMTAEQQFADTLASPAEARNAAPTTQDEQPMTMTENTIRDINLVFARACDGLAEAVAGLDAVRAHQQEMGNDILQEIAHGQMTSTQSELDRFLYNVRKHRNQDVVHAEAILDHAMQTAREFGVLPPNQSSDFRGDYPGDVSGNADSGILRKVAAFDPKAVEEWRRIGGDWCFSRRDTGCQSPGTAS